MRCFVVKAPGRYKYNTTVISSEISPREAYRCVDRQDDPSAWVVRRGDLRVGAPWYQPWDEGRADMPIIPRISRGSYPSVEQRMVLMPSSKLHPDEREAVVQAAAAAGESTSEFIRRAVIDRVARVRCRK